MSPKKIDPNALIADIFGRKALERESRNKLADSSSLFRKRLNFRASGVDFLQEFGSKELVGIDLGWDSIKAVGLRQDKKGVHLKEVKVQPLPLLDLGASEEDYQRAALEFLFQLVSGRPKHTKVAIALNDPSVATQYSKLPHI